MLSLSAWAGMALATVLSGSAAAEGPGGFGFGQRVAGSFLVDLALEGTDGTPFEVQALATLTADGGAVATDTDDYGFGSPTPFFHSPKQGAWKRTGVRWISITLLEFAYDGAGKLELIYRLTFAGEFADRQFDSGSGDVTLEAFLPVVQDPLDPDAVAVGSGGGTFTVRRIKAL